MKNITFLIGNGFDLNVGLKTRYIDFYKVYTEIKPNDNSIIQRFKKDILQSEAHGWKDWKDFELGMGKRSKQFIGGTPAEDFIECFDNFVVCFSKYLQTECANVDWDCVGEDIHRTFNQSICEFYSFVRTVSQDDIKKVARIGTESTSRCILQFNYTDIFDKLLQKSDLWQQRDARWRYMLGKNLHVHGKMEGGYPTIGVDNEAQIENEVIRNHHKTRDIFVKPNFLERLQSRNVNNNIARTDALEVINASYVICAFGVSIGETDQYWWKKIGEWLVRSNGLFIIFDVCGSIDDGISPIAFLNSEATAEERKKEIIDRFARLAGLEPDWLAANQNKIIVELDSSMFQFKLPILKESHNKFTE